MYELAKIRDSIKRKERMPEFIADLKYLKREIDDLLHLAGDTEVVALYSMLNQRKLGI